MVSLDAAGSDPLAESRRSPDPLADAFAAVRARLGLVALLLLLAGLAWWATASQMAGMDAGPGADLGALGWFIGVWVLMMAAMMFPSVAPTVALYSRMTHRRSPVRPLLFASAYLLVWSAVGLFSYGLFELGRNWFGAQLSWDAGGRWAAAVVIAAAAVYELTPLKNACLAKCRSPLGFLLGGWREGSAGAVEMGSKHAAWCVGCCWALMAALFALGVMSLVWMAVVAAVITAEKTLPWRRTVLWITTAVLLVLAVMVAAAPHAVPGLIVPGSAGSGASSMGMTP
jgi:predicted metal-binding membrane protein